MSRNLKSLIADDHSVVRAGIRALLETESDFEVVGEAVNGLIAVKEAARLKPDVVIMDLMMPEMDGVEATRQICSQVPSAHVLLLTTFSTSDVIMEALEAGAIGALMKSVEDSSLISAIRKVANGESCIAPNVRELLKTDPPVPKLTTRQLEILESITQGLTNGDIAEKLSIRADSVNFHVMAILNKLGAANRAEAVAIALRKHLLKI